LQVYNGSAWDTAGGGLTLVKAQTIGTTVSSVTVTDAFSSTYDQYEIMVSGGAASATCNIQLTLGAAASNYYAAKWGNDYVASNFFDNSQNNTAFINCGIGTTLGLDTSIQIKEPFAARRTIMTFKFTSPVTSQETQAGGAFINDTTSYTAFTLTPSTGTFTGGTIRVYGYQNS
jgi:hypothetical protein